MLYITEAWFASALETLIRNTSVVGPRQPQLVFVTRRTYALETLNRAIVMSWCHKQSILIKMQQHHPSSSRYISVSQPEGLETFWINSFTAVSSGDEHSRFRCCPTTPAKRCNKSKQSKVAVGKRFYWRFINRHLILKKYWMDSKRRYIMIFPFGFAFPRLCFGCVSTCTIFNYAKNTEVFYSNNKQRIPSVIFTGVSGLFFFATIGRLATTFDSRFTSSMPRWSLSISSRRATTSCSAAVICTFSWLTWFLIRTTEFWLINCRLSTRQRGETVVWYSYKSWSF